MRTLEEEQSDYQRRLLVKTKEDQQMFIKQHLERRDKTRVLFQ
jgi:hypothetical protein